MFDAQFFTPSIYDILVIATCVTLLSSLYKLRTGPRYIQKDVELISHSKTDERLSHLRITYDNHPVEKLTLTEVRFWNHGLIGIKNDDVASKDPLKVTLAEPSAGKIFQIKAAATHSINDLKVSLAEGGGESTITFNHLAHAHGFALEVLHSGALSLKGTLTNGKAPVRIDEYGGCLAFLMIFVTGGFLFGAIISESVTVVAIAVISLVLTLHLHNLRPHPQHFRKFLKERKMEVVGSSLQPEPPVSTTQALVQMTDADSAGPENRRAALECDTLEDLFLQLFSFEELRMFLGKTLGAKWVEIESYLPAGEATPAAIVHKLVKALGRRGEIQDSFFDALVGARPNREASIRALQRELHVSV